MLPAMFPLASYASLAVVTTISLILLYLKWLQQYWKRRGIPYLEPTFPFGNLKNPITNRKALGLSYADFYKELKARGAKFGGAYVNWLRILLIVDPEYIRHVLLTDFHNFYERGFYYNEKIQPVSANLFTLDDKERWKSLRTKFSPSFTSRKMKIMFDLMVEAGKLLVKHVDEYAIYNKPLHLQDCIGRIASDIVGTCAFGIECNSFKDNTFQRILNETMRATSSFIKVSLCSSMPYFARWLGIPLFPPKNVKFLTGSIDETIKYRKVNKVARNDLLQMMMEMEEKSIIDNIDLKAQCISVFLAGYETTSNSINFVLFELARNQDIQQKLRDEINQVLGEFDEEMNYEAIMDMKYLEMIVCETLRMYNPLAFLTRICNKQYKFPNSDVIIEKGTKIVISNYALCHDPEYFPDPEKFIPERFSEENKAKIIPYTYMPFGEGPRYCIGDRFGKQEMKVITACLVKGYKFKLNSSMRLPMSFSTSGLFIQFAEKILIDIEKIN
ncbi:Cyp6a9 [Trypoxylus dichotomus]